LKIGIYSSHSFPQPVFGQSVRMMNILKQLSKSNKVIVYSPRASDVENSVSPLYTDAVENIATKNFDFPLTYRYTLLNDVNVYRFLRIESDSFDVLQLENSLGTLLLMKKCNFPKVAVLHSAGLKELSWKVKNLRLQGRKREYIGWSCYRFYASLCEKTLARKSKRLIVTSESVREYAANLGADPRKISILRNGVNLEEYQRYSNSVSKCKLRKKLGIPDDSFVFVFHGSFNFDQNVEAIKNILRIRKRLRNHKTWKKCYYIIIGGPIKRLEKSWRENMDDVLFTGYVEDIKPYLFSADCGIAPFPEHAPSGGRLKILEFLSAKLPVIATKNGVYGLEELVDDEPIYIMENFKDLEKLLPIPQVEVNKTKLQNFDWSKIAAVNEEILKEAIENSS